MSYSAPTVTASGDTWSSKRGLREQLHDVFDANPSLTGNQLTLARQSFDAAPATVLAASMVDNYLGGLPVDQSAVLAQLLDSATALALMLQAVNEAAALIAADNTPITWVADETPIGAHQGRVFNS